MPRNDKYSLVWGDNQPPWWPSPVTRPIRPYFPFSHQPVSGHNSVIVLVVYTRPSPSQPCCVWRGIYWIWSGISIVTDIFPINQRSHWGELWPAIIWSYPPLNYEIESLNHFMIYRQMSLSVEDHQQLMLLCCQSFKALLIPFIIITFSCPLLC